MKRFRTAPLAIGTVALAALAGVNAACETDVASVGGVGEDGSGSGGATSGGPTGGAGGRVDKVDILLAIDNSRSMADKQEMLSLAVANLVHALESPPCLDANGFLALSQPENRDQPCPDPGSRRPHAPILDIHIGIVSSSLGGRGSDACPVQSGIGCTTSGNASNDDRAHLLSRADACGDASVPTYEDKGFLAWDPTQKLSPPGESDPAALIAALQEMVVGVGQIGCGYEAPLESIYRFLVDPAPYASIALDDQQQAQLVGVDEALLAQRAEFLRPDSAVAVVMVTDENDCSLAEGGQNHYAFQHQQPGVGPFHLPRARQECATNVDDPCCKSCGQDPGECPPDPSCSDPILDEQEDNIGLRCFEQKRRFGIDFLHPTSRYVDALSAETIADRDGTSIPNPLFSAQRDPGLVFVAGVVGVPWQDVARDPNDLTQGYKTGAELASIWPLVLGDPTAHVSPADPLMVESEHPRTGTHPLTGETIGAPPAQNSINGHEYSAFGDLQYACVSDIPTPRDCTDPELVVAGCDCDSPENDSPLCEGATATTQVRAKAYPGLRQLRVLQGLGEQAVVASICAENVVDTTRADYAYRPAMAALVERVRTRLVGAE